MTRTPRAPSVAASGVAVTTDRNSPMPTMPSMDAATNSAESAIRMPACDRERGGPAPDSGRMGASPNSPQPTTKAVVVTAVTAITR